MATWTSRLLASLAQTPRPCSPAASVRSRMRNPLLPPTWCNLSYILHPCGASSFMEDSSAVWHLKRSRLHAGAPLVGFETLTWAPSSRAEHSDPSLRGRLPQARSFRRRMPK